jgi:virginiamycin B lyase
LALAAFGRVLIDIVLAGENAIVVALRLVGPIFAVAWMGVAANIIASTSSAIAGSPGSARLSSYVALKMIRDGWHEVQSPMMLLAGTTQPRLGCRHLSKPSAWSNLDLGRYRGVFVMTRFFGLLSSIVLCLAVPAWAQTSPSASPAPAAASAKTETRLFQLPEGSLPHDAAPGPDGVIWYTAQRQGALGAIDIASGSIRQIPLGPDSAPHGVIKGPDGAAWITDGGQNAIVRYHPTSGKIDVWKLPESTGYANLNTGAFDRNGVHWFTGQSGIYGRIDPKSGKLDVWPDPKGRGPYGITATPDGTIWYVSLAGSHLARPDLETGRLTIVQPPDANAGLRRVWSDSKGDLWITGWNSGKLYRFRPSSGEWRSWALPGKGAKAYAVYVDGRDIVWVSDFTANTTLQFNPGTQTFTAITGSAANASVRQILGRKNEVYLPESGTNRLMLVTFKE